MSEKVTVGVAAPVTDGVWDHIWNKEGGKLLVCCCRRIAHVDTIISITSVILKRWERRFCPWWNLFSTSDHDKMLRMRKGAVYLCQDEDTRDVNMICLSWVHSNLFSFCPFRILRPIWSRIVRVPTRRIWLHLSQISVSGKSDTPHWLQPQRQSLLLHESTAVNVY